MSGHRCFVYAGPSGAPLGTDPPWRRGTPNMASGCARMARGAVVEAGFRLVYHVVGRATEMDHGGVRAPDYPTRSGCPR